MTPPPLLVDGYASSFTYTATAGIWRVVRVPTLDEVRGTRLPITADCVCGGVGTCTRCVLDDERAWKLRGDE